MTKGSDLKLEEEVAGIVEDLRLDRVPGADFGVAGSEVARAILLVLAKRMGPGFVQEVSNELAERREMFISSDNDLELELGHALEHSDLWNLLDQADINAASGLA